MANAKEKDMDNKLIILPSAKDVDFIDLGSTYMVSTSAPYSISGSSGIHFPTSEEIHRFGKR